MELDEIAERCIVAKARKPSILFLSQNTPYNVIGLHLNTYLFSIQSFKKKNPITDIHS